MDKPKITDITMRVVELLSPLDSIERHRVVQASFVLLGETSTNVNSLKNNSETIEMDTQEIEGLSRQAKIWLKQNAIGMEQLQQVFHIADNSIDIITEIPGKDIKAKTLNAYILCGISRMLISGEPSFDDKMARALCKNSGCYSDANHSVYLKAKGNKLAGSKDVGWKLTAPGLKDGAELIKQITEKI